MSDRNLIPYFLVLGPLLLVGAYANWPAADAIGERGAKSLIDNEVRIIFSQPAKTKASRPPTVVLSSSRCS